jgi:hypothetical protein
MYAQTPFPIGPFASRGDHPHAKLYDGWKPAPERRFRFRLFTRKSHD